MKVLHLIHALEPGGIETWLLRMLATIPRRKIAMDFCCKGPATGSLADRARHFGASVLHCPLRLTHTEFVGGILKLLRAGRYQLVHNHLDVTSGPASWAANLAGVPSVVSFHNTHFAPQTWTRRAGIKQLRELYSRFSIGYSLKHAASITGCSQAVLDAVIPNNRDDSRCRVLHYGVESHARADWQERTKLRQELECQANTPLILHVGRFYAQKNHPGLLRIFQKVQKVQPNAVLVLAGDGPARPEIEAQIADLGISRNVRVLGRRNDVPRLMTASDVFLFPSFHEGLPVVSLEASGCGLPLVGSKIPGTTESIVDGETGYLHDVKDEQSMADSTLRLLQDKNLAAAIGAAAGRRLDERFSHTVSANNLTSVYNDVLQSGRTATLHAA